MDIKTLISALERLEMSTPDQKVLILTVDNVGKRVLLDLRTTCVASITLPENANVYHEDGPRNGTSEVCTLLVADAMLRDDSGEICPRGVHPADLTGTL